jgi:uncharacterized protein (TIGR03084 family)
VRVVDLADLLIDLHEESADLERMLVELSDADWARPTPAAGWTVAHQIAHLHWTDRLATLAATDSAGFAAMAAGAGEDPQEFVDRGAEESLAPPGELLTRWRAGRAALAAALVQVPGGVKLPWFGTAMSPASVATARLMETWAHGEDVAAALSEPRLPTARLRHVVHLGVRTMGYGFMVHGRPAPTEPVYLELTAPDGGTWSYGPPDAPNRLTGPALDFCLLVTQRAHPADLALVATGPVAKEWLEVAQAFAGPPGTGREPTSGGA